MKYLIIYSIELWVCVKSVHQSYERGIQPILLSPSSSSISFNSDLVAPEIQDVTVPDISAVRVPELQASVDDGTIQREKNSYTALSVEDLQLNVNLDTIESQTKYVVTL